MFFNDAEASVSM